MWRKKAPPPSDHEISSHALPSWQDLAKSRPSNVTHFFNGQDVLLGDLKCQGRRTLNLQTSEYMGFFLGICVHFMNFSLPIWTTTSSVHWSIWQVSHDSNSVRLTSPFPWSPKVLGKCVLIMWCEVAFITLSSNARRVSFEYPQIYLNKKG